jgi:hypothetical protein
MARNSAQVPDFESENTGGLLSGLLAEEEDFDRRSLWRLGSWGVGTVAAVVVAVLASQSAFRSRLDQVASDDLARQAQQLRTVAKESQNEARRLASAVETLNGDRDRLYSRVAVLEQGLDSVTGSIAKQNSAPAAPQTVPAPSALAEPQAASQSPLLAPIVAPVATTAPTTVEKPRADAVAADAGPTTRVASIVPSSSTASTATPATSLMPAKSMMAPPDAAAAKLIEPEIPATAVTAAPMPEVTASVSPADNAAPDPVAIQRTEFAVDVGSAKSIGGLRALWRGLLKSNAALAALRPVIAVKESGNGLGMQLRLVAGPLGDAATAAKICAALVEGQRTCETTVFDGQRLAMKADEQTASTNPAPIKPASIKPAHKRSNPKPTASAAPPPKPEGLTFSSLFNRR